MEYAFSSILDHASRVGFCIAERMRGSNKTREHERWGRRNRSAHAVDLLAFYCVPFFPSVSASYTGNRPTRTPVGGTTCTRSGADNYVTRGPDEKANQNDQPPTWRDEKQNRTDAQLKSHPVRDVASLCCWINHSLHGGGRCCAWWNICRMKMNWNVSGSIPGHRKHKNSTGVNGSPLGDLFQLRAVFQHPLHRGVKVWAGGGGGEALYGGIYGCDVIQIYDAGILIRTPSLNHHGPPPLKEDQITEYERTWQWRISSSNNETIIHPISWHPPLQWVCGSMDRDECNIIPEWRRLLPLFSPCGWMFWSICE